MSRSGYSDDYDDTWGLIRWRGAVEASIRGKRGQALLKEMLAALDAMPEKKLIGGWLEEGGNVCALGAVGKARGMDMTKLDIDYPNQVADAFGCASALVKEITFINDDDFGFHNDTPEKRWERVRAWVAQQIKPPEAA